MALLRYIGCTGHAHEVATIFGDEISIRARTLVHDAANSAEVMGDVIAYATRGRSQDERDQIVEMIQRTAQQWAIHNFASGCEVADMLVGRLGFGPAVREALRCTFERWNGAGYPNGAAGSAIPLPMRIVHLSHDMEAIDRAFSPERALEAATERRDRTYDPELADVFAASGRRWLDELRRTEPWDAVLDREPKPHRVFGGMELDDALAVAADFIDLKSPFMGGHSRRCAELSVEAGRLLGLSDEDVALLRRSALVHDFGTTGIPNSIWDKAGSLTRAEVDRVEIHPLLTEQMLRRSPALAVFMDLAAAHHEKCDGSGYHKRVRSESIGPAACILAATEIYVGLTSDRAHRPAHDPESAATEMRDLVERGVLHGRSADAVLAAAGDDESRTALTKREDGPGGLTRREIEVLRLAARGLTGREIASKLFIAPKTADHHIQHIYSKIGVSTRAAAALWAMEHGIVQ